ncbi:hypothetical protein LCGC14_1738910 [marine sediment metagenome]|uniref:Uncharacterized protein n=1 Tax=marine sediment metagenome TaxID=412755 RepID=A0A0F9H7D1_9ZZZZ
MAGQVSQPALKDMPRVVRPTAGLTSLVVDTSPQLGGRLDPNSKQIGWAKGGDITAADPLVLGSDGNYFDVAGDTNFASITVTAGTLFMLQFDGTPTLTHNATTLDLPGEANITAVAGDSLIGYATAANQVHVILYTKADGTAVVDVDSGGWTWLATVTASNAASVDFTSSIDGTYSQYVIVGVDINPATDDTDLWIRTDSNGGASFDAGASDYGWTVDGVISPTPTTADSIDSADAQIVTNSTIAANGLGNGADESSQIIIWISNPAGTTYNKIITWQLGVQGTTAGEVHIYHGVGIRRATAAINAIQFLMSSGNIDGVFRLYGVANA